VLDGAVRGVRSLPVAAAAVIVLATPLIVFWRIGDQGYQGPNPDYMIRLPVSEGMVRHIGIASLVLLLVSVGYLLVTGRIANHQPETRLVLAFAVVGAILGAILRVVTAKVVGANIGAGFAVLFGLPLCIALALTASTRYQARRSQTDTAN
jgi:hypothetical protein